MNNKETDNRPNEHINVGHAERVVSSLAGGGLVAYGLRRGGLGGIALALLGGGLVVRGSTGHCVTYQALGVSTAPHTGAVCMRKAVTINRPREELYQFWRNFENLPRFMDHLKSVTVHDSLRSHWVAKAPLGTSVAWDAEITEEQVNELIAWRSLPDAMVPNSGSVQFVPAPADRGTEVIVSLVYEPPAGQLGAAIARLLGEEPLVQLKGDLDRFKQVMETGEIATNRIRLPEGETPSEPIQVDERAVGQTLAASHGQ